MVAHVDLILLTALSGLFVGVLLHLGIKFFDNLGEIDKWGYFLMILGVILILAVLCSYSVDSVKTLSEAKVPISKYIPVVLAGLLTLTLSIRYAGNIIE